MTKEIRRAIVLGAGASCSYRESPSGLRPPLAREIIPAYTNLPISENRFVLVGQLINYVRDTRGVDPSDFGTWAEDVELFFSEIDERICLVAGKILHGGKLSKDEFYSYQSLIGAYNQLIFLFASIFNEIQNGPISIPYYMLCQELQPNDAVLTFNWDTLLDRALWTTGKWSPSNGYLLSPEAIYDDGWKSPDTFPAPDSGPLYLKLHGSTNWLTAYHHPGVHHSTREKTTLSRYAMDKLYVFLSATREYPTYEGRYWGPYQPFSYCYYPPNIPAPRDDTLPGHVGVRFVVAPDLPEHAKHVIGETDVFSMPLIVPPVKNKQYQRYGNLFSALWGAAEQALSACSVLYLIGYSFPETDVATRDLFRIALGGNVALKKVVIVNPMPDRIEALLTNEFGLNSSIIEVRRQRFEVPFDRSKPLL